MKTILLILSTMMLSISGFGQSPRPLTNADSIQIAKKVEIKAQKLKHSLKESEMTTKSLFLEFVVDTFKIAERERLKVDIDYSTNGMVTATLDANREYDQLLNKYYQMLLKSLNEEDRKILKESQRNWIDFRDSELKLNKVLMNNYYSGGGTIQRVIASSRVLDLTRNRVIELYQYLNRRLK